jgi:hypothetical protein
MREVQERTTRRSGEERIQGERRRGESREQER